MHFYNQCNEQIAGVITAGRKWNGMMSHTCKSSIQERLKQEDCYQFKLACITQGDPISKVIIGARNVLVFGTPGTLTSACTLAHCPTKVPHPYLQRRSYCVASVPTPKLRCTSLAIKRRERECRSLDYDGKQMSIRGQLPGEKPGILGHSCQQRWQRLHPRTGEGRGSWGF